MKKVAILGKHKAELVEVPDPEPKEDWVLVKVVAAPMCTEHKAFISCQNPDFLGHEAVGEVAAENWNLRESSSSGTRGGSGKDKRLCR